MSPPLPTDGKITNPDECARKPSRLGSATFMSFSAASASVVICAWLSGVRGSLLQPANAMIETIRNAAWMFILFMPVSFTAVRGSLHGSLQVHRLESHQNLDGHRALDVGLHLDESARHFLAAPHLALHLRVLHLVHLAFELDNLAVDRFLADLDLLVADFLTGALHVLRDLGDFRIGL